MSKKMSGKNDPAADASIKLGSLSLHESNNDLPLLKSSSILEISYSIFSFLTHNTGSPMWKKYH